MLRQVPQQAKLHEKMAWQPGAKQFSAWAQSRCSPLIAKCLQRGLFCRLTNVGFCEDGAETVVFAGDTNG